MPQIPAFVSSRPDDVIAPQAGDHVAGARGSVSKAFVLGALAGKSRLSGLSELADMTTARLLGRTTAGSGAPEELTAAQVKTLLAIAAGDVSGLGALALLATVGASQIDANAVTTAKIADGNVTLAKMATAAKTVPVTIEIANADGLAVDDSRHGVGGAPYGLAFTKWTLAAFDAAGDPLSTTLTVSFRAKNGSVPGAPDELGSASLSAAASATSSSPGWTALTAGYYTTAVISALSGTAPASIILQLEGTKA